jgi:hypothetical protein
LKNLAKIFLKKPKKLGVGVKFWKRKWVLNLIKRKGMKNKLIKISEYVMQ